jgi:hypothetical protein
MKGNWGIFNRITGLSWYCTRKNNPPDPAILSNSEVFRAQVNRGLKELDQGKGISHEKVIKRLSIWLEK